MGGPPFVHPSSVVGRLGISTFSCCEPRSTNISSRPCFQFFGVSAQESGVTVSCSASTFLRNRQTVSIAAAPSHFPPSVHQVPKGFSFICFLSPGSAARGGKHSALMLFKPRGCVYCCQAALCPRPAPLGSPTVRRPARTCSPHSIFLCRQEPQSVSWTETMEEGGQYRGPSLRPRRCL